MSGIGRLPASAAEDAGLMASVTDLINRVYKVAEDGMWLDGAARTNVAELAGLARAGEIVVARTDGQLVGCVRVQQLDGGVGEFGMLAADPDRRGAGIGRDLVRFAEHGCARAGLHTMQLELLVPREWTHPAKEFLAGWYHRIGYRIVRRGTIDEAYPHLAPQLGTPCDFVIYHKPLSDS
jgi:GNAT superfamily N-acetyltransferase